MSAYNFFIGPHQCPLMQHKIEVGISRCALDHTTLQVWYAHLCMGGLHYIIIWWLLTQLPL